MPTSILIKKARVPTRSSSGCFVCRLRGKKCTPSGQSCESCGAWHIQCIPCNFPVPKLIRSSKSAQRCRLEIKSLADINRNDIAELPITQAYYAQFLRMVQQEDETSDEQENQSLSTLPMLTHHPDAVLNVPHENLPNDALQSTLVIAGNIDNSFANLPSHALDQPSNPGLWNVPQSFAHHVRVHAPVPTSGPSQDPRVQDFAFPNVGSNAPAMLTVSGPMPQSVNQLSNPPDILMCHSPIPFTIDLQVVAMSMGFILVPYPTIPGAGA